MREFGIMSIVVLLALSSVTGTEQRPASLIEDLEHPRPTDAAIYERLRVLTYNVFMRPAPVGWGDKNRCRAERIAEQFVDEAGSRDLIVFNETFQRSAVEKLAGALEEYFPHQTLRRPRSRGLRTNGGLSLVSRHPIEKWRTRRFSECSGDFNDCLASKGFLWALVRVSEHLKVNVIATHMNSGDGQRARDTRQTQLREIRDFLDDNNLTDTWPTVLLGDLNIDGVRWHGRKEASGEPTEFGRAMQLLGNTCASCESKECYDTCNPYPTDAFRSQHGPWPYDPEHTGEVNTHNCVAESLKPCRSPNNPERWKERSRIDYILHFGAPEAMPDTQIDVVDAQSRPYEDDTCDTTYLSDHKGVEATFEITSDPAFNAENDARRE